MRLWPAFTLKILLAWLPEIVTLAERLVASMVTPPLSARLSTPLVRVMVSAASPLNTAGAKVMRAGPESVATLARIARRESGPLSLALPTV